MEYTVCLSDRNDTDIIINKDILVKGVKIHELVIDEYPEQRNNLFVNLQIDPICTNYFNGTPTTISFMLKYVKKSEPNYSYTLSKCKTVQFQTPIKISEGTELNLIIKDNEDESECNLKKMAFTLLCK